jgi:hypothetical protein
MSAWIVRLAQPFRRRMRRRDHRLLDVEIRGLDHLRQALAEGSGVLITPNHASHADPFVMYEVADQLGRPFYVMATWHVFDSKSIFAQWLLVKHGIFSVDRDGADLQAFKEAVRILQEDSSPLVIFAEGEIYHCNDRVTPFRDGPATIALAAARRANRKIVCIPCAVKYEYIDDPTPDLLQLMDELERQIHWRPRPDRSLPERIYAFAEAMLSLKEREFTGKSAQGALPERIGALARQILGRIEDRHGVRPGQATIPERIKEMRRSCLKRRDDVPEGSAERRAIDDDLDDLFFVVQLFSYPGDYISQEASLERIAETLDKFEEDVLRRTTATIRGSRRATVYVDEPVPLDAGKRSKSAAAELTDLLETRVQALLDQHGDRGKREDINEPPSGR